MSNLHNNQPHSRRSSAIATIGETPELKQCSLSTSDSPLNSVLNREGWSLRVQEGIKYLIIGSVSVRYYDYPPEKYHLQVRRMILTNTLSELQELLNFQEASTDRMQLMDREHGIRARQKAFRHSMQFDQERLEDQKLAIIRFQLGGQLLLNFLDYTISSPNKRVDFKLYHSGINYIASAHNLAEFSGVRILNLDPFESHNAQRKLACNIRDIVDIEKPIEPLITAWYRKIAYLKGTLQSVVTRLLESCSSADLRQGLGKYGLACEELLESRRNEPEYQVAIERVRQAHKMIAGQGFDIEIDNLRWISLVREPLGPRY